MGCEVDYKCCAMTTRVLHAILGVVSVVIGFLRFLDFNIFSPNDIVLSLYIIFLGGVMFFMTCGLKACLRSFRFLKFFLGKGAFDLFMGTAILTINEVWWIITGVVFLGVACFCFFLGCFYRKTELEEHEYQEANKADQSADRKKNNPKAQDYKI